jgi:hypothetical protein
MKITRQVIVFDAADLAAESAFWAGLLGGTVYADDDWHSVTVDGESQIACNSRRTTLLRTGRTVRRSRSISTCGSTTSRQRMIR